MNLVVLLTKEDIKTRTIGTHFEIQVPDGVTINFTREAIEELIADFNEAVLLGHLSPLDSVIKPMDIMKLPND